MITYWNIFLGIAGWFSLQLVLSGIAYLVCTIGPDPALALNDATHAATRGTETTYLEVGREGEPRPRRIPPRIAIEACEGKKEGDPCTFSSPDGILNGECLAGSENVFACRPNRGEMPKEAVKEAIPENRTEPDRQAEAPPGQQIGKQASPERKESSDRQTQIDSTVPATASSYYEYLQQHVSDLLSYLAVFIAAAGLTWYGFYKYSTIPLRRLRKVTQQLAGGDLSARVGEGLIHRKSEVVDLGRDIDRMAERIESLVGAQQRLIRDVSHELRSPLARLSVALELARQSAGATHSAPFDRIERESDRLNELIGQLLMLTKLESISGMIQMTELDIASLIKEVAKDVDFEAKSNDRRVIMKPSEPLRLHGNMELLRQALENIVRNAVRYTAAGTEVEISLNKKAGGRGWAHIEVRDHGSGVPESELNDIFRPFYRVNDARERQSGGAGVGLAIADRAVSLHGGRLRAFNAPDTGLIMEVELPMM